MPRWLCGALLLIKTFLDRAALNSVDDLGRWRLEPSGQRLVLQGGREAPVFLQPLAGGRPCATSTWRVYRSAHAPTTG